MLSNHTNPGIDSKRGFGMCCSVFLCAVRLHQIHFSFARWCLKSSHNRLEPFCCCSRNWTVGERWCRGAVGGVEWGRKPIPCTQERVQFTNWNILCVRPVLPPVTDVAVKSI